MKNNILIAIIGEDEDAQDILFKCFKNFHPNKVILLTKKKFLNKSNKIKEELNKFSIETQIKEVSNFLELEEVFMKIKEISDTYKNNIIAINVDCDYMSSCLALSSAFVNGIAAIGVLNEKVIAYPIMKFSYYNAINERKLELLKIINKHNEIESMEKLSKLSKMSLPLIAYHLKGNKDSKGLVEMNLVDTQKKNGALTLSLTELGKLIVNGCIDFGCKK